MSKLKPPFGAWTSEEKANCNARDLPLAPAQDAKEAAATI